MVNSDDGDEVVDDLLFFVIKAYCYQGLITVKIAANLQS